MFAALSLAGIASASCLVPDLNTPVDPAIQLDLLRHAGTVYYTHGKLSDAAACYREALDISGRTEQTQKSAITDLGNLAVIARTMSNYTESANYLTQQLSLIEHMGFGKSALAAAIYVKRGELAALRSLFSEAEQSYTQAVALLTQCAEDQTLSSAGALSELGNLYTAWGKNAQAANTLHKARVMAESSLAQNDPRLIPFLDSEGSFLASTGRFTDAEKELKKALTIAEFVYDGKPMEYAGVMVHLGELYLLTGDFPSAIGVLSSCLEAEGTATVFDPLERAIIMSGLADAFARQRNIAEAGPLAHKAAAVTGDNCVRVPSACAWVHSELGNFYMQEGEWQSAELEFEQALKLREDFAGESPAVADSLLCLSQALRRLNRKKEAKAYETRAAEIMASHKTPGYNGAGIVDVRTLRASK
jgi:tetratricopeptide (TPR) repeat protein